ncbi:hypothetical protein [Caulobacter sp. Root1472]|uniref:hypothetical protein n=1 Tax=Caulobacter sp. Root1472 TaxID=1736470 RepID=UPI0006F2174C|nr:hypothetical protein [Caulobacter sp. Root1472]KQZ31700.1 hypothetical protein ASD47_15620 [Caulobacter sp. Root1472]
MSDPIDPAFLASMNRVAAALDDVFNGSPTPGRQKTVGFALFTYVLGQTEGGRVNFIANSNREDTIAAVKEWLARAEGRMAPGGKA